jgi:hypothetical protein
VIELNSIEYIIVNRFSQNYYPYYKYISLDKAIVGTYSSVLIKIPSNYNTLFPVDSTILLNGKMYTVLDSTANSIQIKYPIDIESIISIRKPLLGTQIGKNSIVFSNMTVPKEYLVPHNIIAIQETRGENSLYVAQIQYTEAKLIARDFDTHVVTYGENKRAYTGIVCFGIPSNGLDYYTACTAELVNKISVIRSNDYPLPVNTIIYINKLAYKITSYDSYDTRFKYYISPSLPTVGAYDIYTVNSGNNYTLYSPIVRQLCLKFAEHIINTGIKSVISLPNLYNTYLTTFLFSMTYFAKEHTVYSNYDPILLSTDFLAEPPTKVEFNFAISCNCASEIYQYENRLIYRCGLYLKSEG